jgi:hypothetical protein
MKPSYEFKKFCLVFLTGILIFSLSDGFLGTLFLIMLFIFQSLYNAFYRSYA